MTESVGSTHVKTALVSFNARARRGVASETCGLDDLVAVGRVAGVNRPIITDACVSRPAGTGWTGLRSLTRRTRPRRRPGCVPVPQLGHQGAVGGMTSSMSCASPTRTHGDQRDGPAPASASGRPTADREDHTIGWRWRSVWRATRSLDRSWFGAMGDPCLSGRPTRGTEKS